VRYLRIWMGTEFSALARQGLTKSDPKTLPKNTDVCARTSTHFDGNAFGTWRSKVPRQSVLRL
jgi:hypothetical protein